MKNLLSENLSSSLNINVLGGNLKSTEEAKLESILERIEDHVFNKKLINGDMQCPRFLNKNSLLN